MKKITFIVILALVQLTVFAQQKINISGSVKNAENKPIESATVSLLNPQDSTVVSATTTDATGRYRFSNIAGGKYLLNISAVGFQKTYNNLNATEADTKVPVTELKKLTQELKAVAVTGKKPVFEQKADRLVVNVDASPSNTGSTVMDVLEKSPGVTVDKDGNISLKGKQNVMVMIDGKPTYMSSTQLASYLKSLPSSAIDQLEIMTNPSAKYDAAGNSGIINIKTKKNKAKGFNGNITLNHTQGVYPKPGGSFNVNYRNNKFNLFANGGYTRWEGYQELDINRNYLNVSDKAINSIFTQNTRIHFINPEANLKIGADYYVNSKTTFGIVASGFRYNEDNDSRSTIYLKDPQQKIDSIVYSPSTTHGKWRNGAINLNFRHQFDSAGTEVTADADYVHYNSGNDQHFDNITYNPDWTKRGETMLSGNLPATVDIYTFKSDFSKTLKKQIKFEAGFKTSYVSTDNNANYFNIINDVSTPDTTKTNHFQYRENINAAYVNLNKQFKKWSVQAGLRLENTNYKGHQLGNPYTVVSNDSSFTKSYVNLFPTVYLSYQASEKNQFTVNFGRRIDRPAYEDLNPFLFFLDQYTYQAGNPYLQPQYTNNIEFAHTYGGFLTTTLNYSNTKNFFSETFEQLGHATIVRNGNIGKRQNAGISVSAQVPLTKWFTSILYTNFNYTKFNGILYGEYLDVNATNLVVNLNNQFKFNKGWSAELSGWYRTRGLEGQIIIQPMGAAYAAISKQLFNDKANIKVGMRDIFYTQIAKGTIDFQQTQASFENRRDSRQLNIAFTWRFGKPFKVAQQRRNTGGADDEQSRVKKGGNN